MQAGKLISSSRGWTLMSTLTPRQEAAWSSSLYHCGLHKAGSALWALGCVCLPHPLSEPQPTLSPGPMHD